MSMRPRASFCMIVSRADVHRTWPRSPFPHSPQGPGPQTVHARRCRRVHDVSAARQADRIAFYQFALPPSHWSGNPVGLGDATIGRCLRKLPSLLSVALAPALQTGPRCKSTGRLGRRGALPQLSANTCRRQTTATSRSGRSITIRTIIRGGGSCGRTTSFRTRGCARIALVSSPRHSTKSGRRCRPVVRALAALPRIIRSSMNLGLRKRYPPGRRRPKSPQKTACSVISGFRSFHCRRRACAGARPRPGRKWRVVQYDREPL